MHSRGHENERAGQYTEIQGQNQHKHISKFQYKKHYKMFRPIEMPRYLN